MAKRKKRHYTSEQREAAVRLMREKGSRAAADQLGINRSLIQKWAAMRSPGRDNNTNTYPPAVRARMVALAAEVGPIEAARQLKVPKSVVQYYRQKALSKNGKQSLAPALTPQPGDAHGSILDAQVSYALGRIEVELEGYARGAGIPQAVFTERVARLLLGQARRQGVGPEHSMPKV